MGRRISPPEAVSITRQHDLDGLVAECRAEGRFAYDTEFVMEDRYEAEVCLIQIATTSQVAIIDPYVGMDLSGVWQLVSDEEVEKVVHSGQEDLGLCVQHTGAVPRNVFDVQIAAGLAGHEYPLSLQKLVLAVLHVRLHKSKTLTDWRRRPLSASQIHYAAEDVAYLLPVHQWLVERLTQLERLSWAVAEFAAFEDVTLYRRVEEEKLWRVKGAGALDGQQLAVLHDLLAWRDELAKTLDRPVRVVLKDYLLTEVAKYGISTFAELRDLRGLNLSDKQVHALARVVQNAVAKPESQWPHPKPRDVEGPGEAAMIELVTAIIRNHCFENELAYSLVATKRAIREFIRDRSMSPEARGGEVELLSGWRGQLVGGLLVDLFDGRRSLRVKRVNGEWGLEVSPPGC